MKNNRKPQPFMSKPLIKSLLVATGLCLVGHKVQAQDSGLLDVYQMAAEYDTSLAQSKAQFESDKQQLIALEGGLYPQISAGANISKVDSSNDAGDNTSRNLSVTLNQSIYQQQVWARIDQSKIALQASELSLQTAKQNLILKVTEAYFNVLTAQQTLTLFKAREKSDWLQLESAQASAEVGLASQVDVLQAKSSYDLSKSNRISAENSLDISREELLKLTGKSFGTLKKLPFGTELPLQKLDMMVIENQAQSNNLAVLSAQAQANISKQEIEVQKSTKYPTVSVQAQLADTHYVDGGYGDSSNASVSLNASVPLYTGGSTKANISSARYQSQKAFEVVRDSKNQARVNARTQAHNLERGIVLISALREAVKSNDAFLEAAEEGLKVGLKDMLEVLSARSNQVLAHKNLIEAMHNQILNGLNLEAVIGDLTVDDLKNYDQLLISDSDTAE